MICFKCLHTKTRVVNSRTHKKTAQVWRRRHCENCNTTFTTYERRALFDEVTVINRHNIEQPFNIAILTIDIHDALQSSDKQSAVHASWLVRSIEDEIALRKAPILTTTELIDITHATLSRFNTLAGIQYAAKHQLIDKIKRPRRRS